MKTERLLSILMILLHRRKITASELAGYFEVSVRTIQRDMDSLAVAGIPLYASVGKGRGLPAHRYLQAGRHHPDQG